MGYNVNNCVVILRADGQGGINRLFRSLFDSTPEGRLELELYDSRSTGRIDFLKLPLRLYRFWKLLNSSPIALVHINLASNGSTYRKFLFSQLCQFAGVPYLLHLHGAEYVSFYSRSGLVGQWVIHRLFSGACKVIVLGEYWARFVKKELDVDPLKVVVLPNAVKKVASVHAQAIREKVKILFLGRVGARKGVPELLGALAAPELKDHCGWHAVIAGDGDVEFYKNEANEKGLSGKVSFPGWVGVAEVEELLTSSDILVLPSHAENQPLSMLEGMGAGLAVIATPVGAVPEVIRDGVNGLLVPVGDADALAKALARVVGSQELRLKLGQQARLDFEKTYDISKYRDKLETIYDDVLGL